MRIEELMTKNPKCCTKDTSLREVARMMVDCDCGEIPIVDSAASLKPIGVITDRDIVCRTVAQGKNPLDLKARDCMTTPAVTCTPDATVEECCRVMEERQVRRIPVVDRNGRLCGIVSQADLARILPVQQSGVVVKLVSQSKPMPTTAQPA
jgi:CBS domain-containing protein